MARELMVDMADYLGDFDDFAERVKAKIRSRSDKHRDNCALHISNIAGHLVDELAELVIKHPRGEYTAQDKEIYQKLYDVIFQAWACYNANEFIDIAALAWMGDLAMRNDGWITPNETHK
jgi:hypothetical protein